MCSHTHRMSEQVRMTNLKTRDARLHACGVGVRWVHFVPHRQHFHQRDLISSEGSPPDNQMVQKPAKVTKHGRTLRNTNTLTFSVHTQTRQHPSPITTHCKRELQIHFGSVFWERSSPNHKILPCNGSLCGAPLLTHIHRRHQTPE